MNTLRNKIAWKMQSSFSSFWGCAGFLLGGAYKILNTLFVAGTQRESDKDICRIATMQRRTKKRQTLGHEHYSTGARNSQHGQPLSNQFGDESCPPFFLS